MPALSLLFQTLQFFHFYKSSCNLEESLLCLQSKPYSYFSSSFIVHFVRLWLRIIINHKMESDREEGVPEVLIYDIESENNEVPTDLRDDPEPYEGEERREVGTEVVRVKPFEHKQFKSGNTPQLEQLEAEATGPRRATRTKRERRPIVSKDLTALQQHQLEIELATDIGQSSQTLLRAPSEPQQTEEKIIKVDLGQSSHKQEQENIIFYQESLQSSNVSLQIDETTRGLLNQVCHEEDDDSDQYEEEELDRVQPLSEGTKAVRKVIPPQSTLPEQSILVQASPDLLLVNVVPQNYKLLLFVSIERGLFGLASTYRLFLGKEHQFLLSAKKEIFKYYSNFIISRHPHKISRRKDYFGRLEGNFIGTRFKLYLKDQKNVQNIERLKVDIEYNKNLVGFMGPRTFAARKINPKNKHYKYGGYSLEEVLERNEVSKMAVLHTEQPVLVRGKYRLDFGGKVRIPSAKNFILEGIPLPKKQPDLTIHEYEQERQYEKEEKKEEKVVATRSLLFGKVSDDCYRMEVSYPLTVFEAFGICLSSLDRKLMVN